MYKAITKCRICGNSHLPSVLHLGEQALTGVFPAARHEKVTTGPLELVKCHPANKNDESCGLLQLRHSYVPEELYGHNYGYRSGLNPTMITHLHGLVGRCTARVELAPGDVVIDIGSNDSTLLQGYKRADLTFVGFDPTGVKFSQYYPPHIALVPDFFSAAAFRAMLGDRKAKIITSIAMFYDLEEPMRFMTEVRDCLAEDGVWVFEQSYMPTMLEMNSYDTVCHEHLEYYGLSQIKWMTDRVGLEIVDVALNAVNGGSFTITVRKARAGSAAAPAESVSALLDREREVGLDGLEPYERFRREVFDHRDQLISFVRERRARGQKVFGYGASTKGNVILQFCGFTSDDIEAIAEINPDKFGKFTPGTLLPIISEVDAKSRNPDFMIVLPWHFRDYIVAREDAFRASGGKLVFPLPRIETVD